MDEDDPFARMHAGIADAFERFLEEIGPDAGERRFDELVERLERAVHSCPLPTPMCQHLLDALECAARAIHERAPRPIPNFVSVKGARQRG